MDTSLKKLNRLELLELLVQLSEDNDYLKAENEHLRQTVASRSAMPHATKVGSIAELAMRTNGFFEAAQRSADDYLREIKRLRDQLAARAAAEGLSREAGQVPADQAPSVQAQQASEAMIQQAREQAQAILKRANSQAEAIVADARAKSEATIADANRQSHDIVARANHQADAVISAARNDANRQAAQAVQTSHGDTGKQPIIGKNPALSAPIRGRHVRAAVEGA